MSGQHTGPVRHPDTRYEECMQQLDKPYAAYEEEREALGEE